MSPSDSRRPTGVHRTATTHTDSQTQTETRKTHLEEHAEGPEHRQAGVLDLGEGVVGADAGVGEAERVEAEVTRGELLFGVLLWWSRLRG